MKLLGNCRTFANANVHTGLGSFGLWIFLGRANFRFIDTQIIRVLVFGPKFFRSSQMRLYCRYKQQSQAEPLNTKIRSGAEDEASEIETDRERWMDFFCGSEVTLVAFSCRSDLRKLELRLTFIISFHISFFLLLSINKAL